MVQAPAQFLPDLGPKRASLSDVGPQLFTATSRDSMVEAAVAGPGVTTLACSS